MLFSLNFVKFMGIFYKVFAAYKQAKDSTAFLYQIAEILFLLSTPIHFWYLSQVSVLTVSKTNLSGVIKWNILKGDGNPDYDFVLYEIS